MPVQLRGRRLKRLERVELFEPDLLIPQGNRHPQLALLEIRQRLVDFLEPVSFGDQSFEFDSPARRHLKNFFDIVGLAA